MRWNELGGRKRLGVTKLIFAMSTGMHAHYLRPLEDNWLYLVTSSHYLFEEEVGLLVFFLESSTFLFSL
jgi:hypothetical protein